MIDSNKILSYLPEYLKRNQYKQAVTVTQGALIIDPSNIQARLELAHLYEKLGDPVFARIEYKNVLILDPQNQEANQKILL